MTRASIVTAVLLLLTGSFIFAASDRSAAFTQQSPQAIVITGATVVDGTGRAPLNDAVVVITGDSITAVGQRGRVSIPAQARVIDAPGLVLAPGFIDAHNHSDRGFSDDPSAASQVSQGITTVVVGQDGGSAFPIGEYLRGLDKNPIAPSRIACSTIWRIFSISAGVA